MTRGLLVPVLWAGGLVLSLIGQWFHQAAWLADHRGVTFTGDDIVTMGDYPSVSAGWLLIGWLPVSAGLLLTRRKSVCGEKSTMDVA